MSVDSILLIEDDSEIRESVRILLESENFYIREAENGWKGLELLDENTDLVILDVMMPGMSGLRTCEEIRKISNVPVLFLTAKSQESDKLIGLMAGGDDYLELDHVRINKTFNEVYINEEERVLTDIEYHILLMLMNHPKMIFSAQAIYEQVWDEPYFYSCNGTVMVHIRKLRMKIEADPNNPKHIKTVWGKGYRFETRATEKPAW